MHITRIRCLSQDSPQLWILNATKEWRRSLHKQWMDEVGPADAATEGDKRGHWIASELGKNFDSLLIPTRSSLAVHPLIPLFTLALVPPCDCSLPLTKWLIRPLNTFKCGIYVVLTHSYHWSMYANKWSFAEGPIAYQGESLLPLSHHRLIPRRHWIWTATGQLPVDKIRNLNVWHGIRGWMEMAIQWSNTKGFFPFNKWEPIEGHKRINNNSRGNDLGDVLGLIPSNVSLSCFLPCPQKRRVSYSRHVFLQLHPVRKNLFPN